MKGSFQPTRPGFSASNAGLRASSTAVRRSQDRGSSTSRHLPQTVKVSAVQRDENGPIGLELSKDADMVHWLQQQLTAQQGPLCAAVSPAGSCAASTGWNVEPLAVSTPPQKSGAATAGAAKVTFKQLAKHEPLLKAKTLPMVQLAAGGWKKKSKFEGDLVLKCYFTKKKLCWEILDGNLTYKCEMRWPEIQYLRSSQVDDVELLELDVRQPPSFFEELDPQPKKRAVWKACQDFTGGQVSMGKRQQFFFLPGKLEVILPDFFALNKHLQHDHERVETPHSGPSKPEDSSNEQQLVKKSVQPAYTEQDFLHLISQGDYAYPLELPAEFTGNLPASSQSASSNFYPVHTYSPSDQEQTSTMAAPAPHIQEEPMELGEPNSARDSFDFDFPELPSGMPTESFMELMRIDSAELGLPADLAASLAVPASHLMPVLQPASASEDSSLIDEMMDWDAMCS